MIDEQLSEQRIDAFVRVLDPRWLSVMPPMRGLRAWANRSEHLTVICSAAPYDDGLWWIHFSMSGKRVLPSWEQLIRAKEAILGTESKAIQVLAPRSQWVNIHPNCLHLWVCLGKDPLPDFTMGTGSL